MNTPLAFLAMFLFVAGAGHLAFAQYDDKLAVLETGQGQIVLEFFPDDAPNHVANFAELAEDGFYDGTLFHRIISGFMIQGGDPNTLEGDPSTWGQGGPGTTVPAEFNDIKHNRGILSMARSASPDSAGSQFFIVHQNSNFLDRQYTVFGRVVTQESFETLDKIAALETMPRDIPTNPEQARIIKISIVPRADVPGILQQGEPERVGAKSPPPMIEPVQSQPYENKELGIVFSAPPGWFLQQPEKTDPDIPDVVAIGPQTGLMNPLISLIIQDTNGTSFDEIVQERRTALDEVAAAGGLEEVTYEETEVHGSDALVITALGIFESADMSINVKFKEYLIYEPDTYYMMYYANSVDEFETYVPVFMETVESFRTFETVDETVDETHEGGGCLIATATFGSELAPQVQQLREIRDGKVMGTEAGAAFMAGFNQLYYSFSPGMADIQRENPVVNEAVRLAITPMLASLSVLHHVEINSEYDILGYGSALILLNLGMYVAAPAMIIYKIRR